MLDVVYENLLAILRKFSNHSNSCLNFYLKSRPQKPENRPQPTIKNARNMKSVSRAKLPYSISRGFSIFERTSSKSCPFFKCSLVLQTKISLFYAWNGCEMDFYRTPSDNLDFITRMQSFKACWHNMSQGITHCWPHGTVDDLGQIFDLLNAWKLKSKNAPRDLKFNHYVAIWL